MSEDKKWNNDEMLDIGSVGESDFDPFDDGDFELEGEAQEEQKKKDTAKESLSAQEENKAVETEGDVYDPFGDDDFEQESRLREEKKAEEKKAAEKKSAKKEDSKAEAVANPLAAGISAAEEKDAETARDGPSRLCSLTRA